jgi:hypothetical protein
MPIHIYEHVYMHVSSLAPFVHIPGKCEHTFMLTFSIDVARNG